MKCVYLFALFSLVALQYCHAAPVPDEEKKVDVVPDVAVESVAPVVAAAEHVEVPSEPVPATESATVLSDAVTVAVEEKKP